MSPAASVQGEPLVSDTRVRETLARAIRAAVVVERRLTRAELAAAARVNIHTLDSITSADSAKHRRVCMADALSIAAVLGEPTVNALLALIGFGGASALEGEDSFNSAAATANMIGHLAVIARAAADGHIDHIERPACQAAADLLIAEALPLSSAGRR